MRDAGYGLKAATITPEGRDDVGSPNRILREEVDGKVIIRTGRRIPGVTPVAGVHDPISVVRMAVDDAYGAKQWREGAEGAPDEIAYRTEKISRGTCRAVAEYAFRTAREMGGRVYGGPKWTVSPVYEGMLKEELDAAAERHAEVDYQPVLIDATYAGLISGAAAGPLVIPALNRDGDCLSDLVMPMFGSIAGAESVLLAFDDDFETQVAMAEAPHGTAPALEGKDIANPMAMILAARRGPALRRDGRRRPARRGRRARSTRACSRRRRPACGRRTSAATPRRPSSPTTSSRACARRSTSGRRSGRRRERRRARNPFGHIDLRVASMAEALPFYEALLPALGFTQRYDGAGVEGLREHRARRRRARTSASRRAPGTRRTRTGSRSGRQTRPRSTALAAVVAAAGARDVSGPKAMPYGPGYYAVYFADPGRQPLRGLPPAAGL